MSRSSLAALAIVAALGVAAALKKFQAEMSPAMPAMGEGPEPRMAAKPPDAAQDRSTSRPQPPSAPSLASTAPSLDASDTMRAQLALADEATLMNRLRSADPATAIELVRQGNQMYPRSPYAEEREARNIDALVALGNIGQAHAEAMLFVQHHPTGPFSTHVMNLMGVHPRPPGAVPEPTESNSGR